MSPSSSLRIVLTVLLACASVEAFLPIQFRAETRGASRWLAEPRGMFQLDADCGDQGVAKMKFKPILDVGSSALVVKVPIPFGMDAEPVPDPNGLKVVVTKAGKNGEQPGDVLRFASYWSMAQFEGSGLASTIGNFGGAPSWKLGMFDVYKAQSFNEVIEALTSNEPRRGTKAVTLVFERPPTPS